MNTMAGGTPLFEHCAPALSTDESLVCLVRPRLAHALDATVNLLLILQRGQLAAEISDALQAHCTRSK